MFEYFIFMAPAIALVAWAQHKVKSAYAKNSQIASSSGLTGSQMARILLDRNGLSNVSVEATPGQLTDHYDPRVKAVRLSEGVYNGRSVAAMGIVAHEIGHVVQDAKAYAPMRIRATLVPVANFGSSLGPMIIIMGLFIGIADLMYLGIAFFTAAVLFQIVTLPVEFNASRRALGMLEGGGYMYQGEVAPTKQVLNAAAFTYLAATLAAVMQLAYYLLLAGRRR
jgi:uncharacterized protein